MNGGNHVISLWHDLCAALAWRTNRPRGSHPNPPFILIRATRGVSHCSVFSTSHGRGGAMICINSLLSAAVYSRQPVHPFFPFGSFSIFPRRLIDMKWALYIIQASVTGIRCRFFSPHAFLCCIDSQLLLLLLWWVMTTGGGFHIIPHS